MMPTTTATVVETMPISSDTRAPWKMQAATSRPSRSVPSGNFQLWNGQMNGLPAMSHGSAG